MTKKKATLELEQLEGRMLLSATDVIADRLGPRVTPEIEDNNTFESAQMIQFDVDPLIVDTPFNGDEIVMTGGAAGTIAVDGSGFDIDVFRFSPVFPGGMSVFFLSRDPGQTFLISVTDQDGELLGQLFTGSLVSLAMEIDSEFFVTVERVMTEESDLPAYYSFGVELGPFINPPPNLIQPPGPDVGIPEQTELTIDRTSSAQTFLGASGHEAEMELNGPGQARVLIDADSNIESVELSDVTARTSFTVSSQDEVVVENILINGRAMGRLSIEGEVVSLESDVKRIRSFQSHSITGTLDFGDGRVGWIKSDRITAEVHAARLRRLTTHELDSAQIHLDGRLGSLIRADVMGDVTGSSIEATRRIGRLHVRGSIDGLSVVTTSDAGSVGAVIVNGDVADLMIDAPRHLARVRVDGDIIGPMELGGG